MAKNEALATGFRWIEPVRRRWRWYVMVSGLLAIVATLNWVNDGEHVGAAAKPDQATAEPKDKKFPFFPSAQTTADGKKVLLTDYPKNSSCTGCHKKIGHEWEDSMHALAMKDPIFLALYKVGHKETKGFTDKLCAGCHSSPMVVAGHSAPHELDKLDEPVHEGVSCVVCHSITSSHLGLTNTFPANGSFVTDPKGAIMGPHHDRPCHKKGRATVKNDLLTKSEFCANCHGAVHPLNGFVIEKTYEEWRGSIYAAKGIQCQDCHMQPVDLAIQTAQSLKKVPNPGRVTKNGEMRDHVYSHSFVGANAVVPKLLGAEAQAQLAEKLLKSAASLEMFLPERAAPGSMVQLRIKVNNETAGHNLPTSLVEVRQMWLDVQATDAAGKVLFRSGAVDAKGEVDADAVMFHAIAVDAQGKPTVKPWEMVRFSYYHTVPPRGYTLERYAFHVPATAKAPIQVKAILRYRSFPQHLAQELLGKDAPTVPIVDMTSLEKKVELRP